MYSSAQPDRTTQAADGNTGAAFRGRSYRLND